MSIFNPFPSSLHIQLIYHLNYIAILKIAVIINLKKLITKKCKLATLIFNVDIILIIIILLPVLAVFLLPLSSNHVLLSIPSICSWYSARKQLTIHLDQFPKISHISVSGHRSLSNLCRHHMLQLNHLLYLALGWSGVQFELYFFHVFPQHCSALWTKFIRFVNLIASAYKAHKSTNFSSEWCPLSSEQAVRS